MIIKFDDFIKESVEITELPLIFSDRLLDTLKTINHKIAHELVDLHNNNKHEYNVSFIDKSEDSPDTVTQIQVNKAKLLLNDDDLQNLDKLYQNNSDVYKKYRSDIKIGRLVTKIFGDQFPRNKARGYSDSTPNDLESFVNMYKTSDPKLFENFEIVEGDDISYWYHEDRYYNEDGSLGSSCMKEASYLEMYDDNPNKIKLLLLRPEEDKTVICGRALLWSLDEPENRIFMDRVYTNDYSDEQLFIMYAKKNGWLYKSVQAYGSEPITDSLTDRSKELKMSVNIKPVEYEYYPYLDTMFYYDKNAGYLTSKDRDNECQYILTSSYGECHENDNYDDPSNYVYSNYHGEDINRDHARECEIGDDWVRTEEAIYVSNAGRRYAVPGSDLIVKSDYSNKWFMKAMTEYSDLLSSYIFEDSIRYIYKDINKEDYDITHKNEIPKLEESGEIIKIKSKYYYNTPDIKKEIKKREK